MVQMGYWEFKKWERREVKQDTRYRAPDRKIWSVTVLRLRAGMTLEVLSSENRPSDRG